VTSNNRAFTLIELMVALTLLGLVATMLVAGTRLGLGISSRGNNKADAIRTDELGRTVLRNQLRGALPFRYWTQSDDKRMEQWGFEGDGASIRFVSRDGVMDGPNSLPRWVNLSSKKTSRGETRLTVDEYRILSPDNQAGDVVSGHAEMFECDDVRIEYLDTVEEKPHWSSTWNAPDRKPLPLAVRIRCGSGRQTTKLVIPLDYAEASRQGLGVQ
jgi:prepilin-type N-terminal cleavage/methylation domain-containing protein